MWQARFVKGRASMEGFTAHQASKFTGCTSRHGSVVEVGLISLYSSDDSFDDESATASVTLADVDAGAIIENLADILTQLLGTDEGQATDSGLSLIRGLLEAIETGRVVVRSESGEVVSTFDSGRVRS